MGDPVLYLFFSSKIVKDCSCVDDILVDVQAVLQTKDVADSSDVEEMRQIVPTIDSLILKLLEIVQGSLYKIEV